MDEQEKPWYEVVYDCLEVNLDEMKYIGQNFLKPKWQNFDLK